METKVSNNDLKIPDYKRSYTPPLECRFCGVEKDTMTSLTFHLTKEHDAHNIKRFFSHVTKLDTGECWIWTGPSKDDHYGLFSSKGKDYQSHRFMMKELVTHPYLQDDFLERCDSDTKSSDTISDGRLMVLHYCDNPECVNPNHLYVGSIQHNNWDEYQRRGHKKEYNDKWAVPHCPLSKEFIEECKEANKKEEYSILDYETAEEIRDTYENTEHSYRDIADHYDVHYTTIQHVIQGRTFTEPE